MASLKSFLRTSLLTKDLYFIYRFVRDNKYFPNFSSPRTYNEKINYRKKNHKNQLFKVCADKIAVKDYIANSISKDIVIETYFEGDQISFSELKTLIESKGDCLLKANHNSGPVYLLTQHSSDEAIKFACTDVNRQLKVDFGKEKNELWYRDIKPRVLVEKRIEPESGEADLKDYKFHIFAQNDGSQKVVLHIDYDRSTNHNRSFFDEELNWLPYSVLYPCVRTETKRPKNYDEMLRIVKELARPFSYVRIDMYNVDGKIFFGEMTFAHGGGAEPFSTYAHDLWMGKLWQGDPRY